ncbi:MAG: hypothetical protein A3F72_15445 [Bacteroidetes bacterium RIFCSPLOWO2_12_FULL_35_15]|nr:MAG: hypothetical protein A3F72_15445 [Bacteroidetes bacterium RIFCSPLOWO2_12_FULL_35_15]
MKFTAIVVEDEYKVREVFLDLIHHYCKEIEIVGQAENILEAYDLILSTKPNIVFLDIEMPNGTGFDLLAKFPDPPFEVIFVTSYGNYAIKAIKFSALDYLLKPVMIADLLGMFERVKAKFKNRNQFEQYKVLFENLNSQTAKKMIVNTKSKIESVFLHEIIYFEGDRNYTTIHIIDRTIYVAKNLKEYEDLLCIPESSFVRSHKAYIVNFDFVHSIGRGEDYTIRLKNNIHLEISRRKKQELVEKLNSQ